jgi:hypothetical protein
MPARWQVARIVGQLALEPGPVVAHTFVSENGPYIVMNLPGGDVSLFARDPGALGRLGRACLQASRELRVAQAHRSLPGSVT